MLLIYSKVMDPYFNIAMDEYSLTKMKREMLIFWRNSRAVIVGANQNSHQEVNLDYAKENEIAVVRRMTGGGAVFHDQDNINFTMISPFKLGDFDNYKKFTQPIVDFLKTLGVDAQLRGRNDLVIADQKFSGNAQAVKSGWIIHHGTLLYNSDFSKLSSVLKPSDSKIESKGIKSVRARVTNIADHMENPPATEDFIGMLMDYFKKEPGTELYEFSPKEIEEIKALSASKYSTWDWNFGTSPKYNYTKETRLTSGGVELNLNVENGIIVEAKIYGDFFGKENLAQLEEKLLGVAHDKEAVRAALEKVQLSDYISGCELEDFLALVY